MGLDKIEIKLWGNIRILSEQEEPNATDYNTRFEEKYGALSSGRPFVLKHQEKWLTNYSEHLENILDRETCSEHFSREIYIDRRCPHTHYIWHRLFDFRECSRFSNSFFTNLVSGVRRVDEIFAKSWLADGLRNALTGNNNDDSIFNKYPKGSEAWMTLYSFLRSFDNGFHSFSHLLDLSETSPRLSLLEMDWGVSDYFYDHSDENCSICERTKRDFKRLNKCINEACDLFAAEKIQELSEYIASNRESFSYSKSFPALYEHFDSKEFPPQKKKLKEILEMARIIDCPEANCNFDLLF